MIPTYKTWEEFQSICNVIHQKRINKRLIVQVVQLRDEEHNGRLRGRSQFLALVIYDEFLDKWMSLKLSTVRKIWKFLVKKDFDTSRKLYIPEIKKLQRNDS